MGSICTAQQALSAFEYWLGYYEKANANYANTRDKSAFTKNKGANNYTYAGYICGLNGPGAAWCAMQVSLSIYEACGNDKAMAKQVLHGVWPYAACNQLYDAAPANMKGRRGAWSPQPGDVIVFSDNGTTRTHTGMVYKVDGSTVYTYEGNKSNMCKACSYKLNSSYIWGYVRPAYAVGSNQQPAPQPTPPTPPTPQTPATQYGQAVNVALHQLTVGNKGPEVKTLQRILYSYGLKGSDGKPVAVDGEFGVSTQYAVKTLQAKLGVAADGVVGAGTWKAMLTELW